MTVLITLLALQQVPYTDSDMLWSDVAKAYKNFKSFSYTVRVVRMVGRKTEVKATGNANYEKDGAAGFKYQDHEEKLTAYIGRDENGEWGQTATGGTGVGGANTALGFAENAQMTWAYDPINFARAGSSGHYAYWDKAAPILVTFRNVPCYLVSGTENKVPIKAWIERKRLVLLRVEEDYGASKSVTAFSEIKTK